MIWSMLFLMGARGGVQAFAPSCAAAVTATRRGFSVTTTRLQQAASSSPPPPPTQYLLTYDYVPDVLEKRGPYRAEHLQLAADAVSEGTCLHGGPKAALDGDGAPPNGAVFVFTSVQAAQDFVEKDPYVSGGIVTNHVIEAWTVAVSKDN